MAIAFGLLCFLCGLLLYQFMSFRKQSERIDKARMEDRNDWLQARTKLDEEKAKLQEEKEAWEADRDFGHSQRTSADCGG
jgi:hypothetical protein